jgi:hypothetical protein
MAGIRMVTNTSGLQRRRYAVWVEWAVQEWMAVREIL